MNKLINNLPTRRRNIRTGYDDFSERVATEVKKLVE